MSRMCLMGWGILSPVSKTPSCSSFSRVENQSFSGIHIPYLVRLWGAHLHRIGFCFITKAWPILAHIEPSTSVNLVVSRSRLCLIQLCPNELVSSNTRSPYCPFDHNTSNRWPCFAGYRNHLDPPYSWRLHYCRHFLCAFGFLLVNSLHCMLNHLIHHDHKVDPPLWTSSCCQRACLLTHPCGSPLHCSCSCCLEENSSSLCWFTFSSIEDSSNPRALIPCRK